MLNDCSFVGRLTHTPEVKQTGNGGVPYINFSIAVDRSQSGEEKTTDFIDCKAWRKTAEFIGRYFDKGDVIGITGELNVDRYEKGGEKKKAVYINVRQAHFCGGKKKEAESDDLPY